MVTYIGPTYIHLFIVNPEGSMIHQYYKKSQNAINFTIEKTKSKQIINSFYMHLRSLGFIITHIKTFYLTESTTTGCNEHNFAAKSNGSLVWICHCRHASYGVRDTGGVSRVTQSTRSAFLNNFKLLFWSNLSMFTTQ